MAKAKKAEVPLIKSLDCSGKKAKTDVHRGKKSDDFSFILMRCIAHNKWRPFEH